MQWGVPSYYSLVRHAGSGAYGSVDVFVDTRSGEMRAIKKINNVFTDGLRVATHAVRELRMLHHLQHPNIISLCDVVVPDSCDAFDDVYLVMQHMPYDLRYVMESGCVLSARHIRHIMYQLVLAIQHIHAAHIIHRDVKPENILLDACCNVKLCDFGLARGNRRPTIAWSRVQTIYYRAPEVALQCPRLSNKIDMWSVGCVMAELLAGRVLFPCETDLDLIRCIFAALGTPQHMSRLGAPENIRKAKMLPRSTGVPLQQLLKTTDADALDLVRRLLAVDPRERISAHEALYHPYFSECSREEHILYAEHYDYSYERRCISLESIRRKCYETLVEIHTDLGARHS